MAVIAACGSDAGGGTGGGESASAKRLEGRGDDDLSWPRTSRRRGGHVHRRMPDGGGRVRPARPDDDAHPARTGATRVGNVVPEFGCTYIGPTPPSSRSPATGALRRRGHRRRSRAGRVRLRPGRATAAGPLDSERDLDLGDRAYTNSRVTGAPARARGERAVHRPPRRPGLQCHRARGQCAGPVLTPRRRRSACPSSRRSATCERSQPIPAHPGPSPRSRPSATSQSRSSRSSAMRPSSIRRHDMPGPLVGTSPRTHSWMPRAPPDPGHEVLVRDGDCRR